jgi:hypothetical protein
LHPTLERSLNETASLNIPLTPKTRFYVKDVSGGVSWRQGNAEGNSEREFEVPFGTT